MAAIGKNERDTAMERGRERHISRGGCGEAVMEGEVERVPRGMMGGYMD